MKQRINTNFLCVCAIAIIVTSLCLAFVFYEVFTEQMEREVRTIAELMEMSFNLEPDNDKYANEVKLINDRIRVTVIDTDGVVRYDSFTDADDMDNHFERPEVIQAVKTGRGEARRYSESLGDETYYYAIKLNDGYILRVSENTDIIYRLFMRASASMAVIILACFLVTNVITGKMTDRLIEPINKIDLENDIYSSYDELAPFVHKIQTQKGEIVRQMRDIETRANTLTSIMQNMREGLVLIDNKGIVVSVNNSAKAIFAVGDNIVGRNFYSLSRNHNITERIAGALNGKFNDIDHILANKTYNISFSPVKGGGAIILCFDITEQRERENLRREFTANVSHELKTPLTTIMGYSELMEIGMVRQGDERELAGKIKNEAKRLLSLIEDIINLSEIEESGSEAEKKDVDLEQVALEVERTLSAHAHNSGVKLKLDTQKVIVNGSAHMLYEIIYNLADNAIKYNKENGEVLIKVEKADDKARIIVSDNGIGIPGADRDRVFERFYRVDKSRSRAKGGTGLGLSIVKHAVNFHNGTIEMDSHEGKGTTITITI
ncbi:MAG: GHKL domain-containing protein [Ruminococcaceae bacterium]|nr:GHKL domain-containing protein [Oscillospiraceae bacterium]